MPDQHCGGRARDAVHVVMLGQPVAPVAPFFDVARQIERIAQRLRGVAAFDDGGKIEHG